MLNTSIFLGAENKASNAVNTFSVHEKFMSFLYPSQPRDVEQYFE